MLGESYGSKTVRRFGLPVLFCLVSGCQPQSPLERSGVLLPPPPSWKAVPADAWPVPGTPLAAWSGPHGASLTVYRQSVAIAGSSPQAAAESALTGVANRFANLPGLTETLRRIETWGGLPAGRLELVGQGMGDALAPSGMGVPIAPKGQTLIPTRRVLVAVPGTQTIFLVWHAPESSRDELEVQIEAFHQAFQIRPTLASY
jgi:hypothetical protein